MCVFLRSIVSFGLFYARVGPVFLF
eukprot:SAG11_NODE_36140_length_263_cov_0.634146_1_plen_24_part_01